MVTPLAASECGENMNYLESLGQKICQMSHAPDCPALEMLTVFRHGYSHGDALIPANSDGYGHTEVNGHNPIIAGTGENTYYAYCVECNSCQEWSEWSGCAANCKRTKTRTCQGGDECTE